MNIATCVWAALIAVSLFNAGRPQFEWADGPRTMASDEFSASKRR